MWPVPRLVAYRCGQTSVVEGGPSVMSWYLAASMWGVRLVGVPSLAVCGGERAFQEKKFFVRRHDRPANDSHQVRRFSLPPEGTPRHGLIDYQHPPDFEITKSVVVDLINMHQCSFVTLLPPSEVMAARRIRDWCSGMASALPPRRAGVNYHLVTSRQTMDSSEGTNAHSCRTSWFTCGLGCWAHVRQGDRVRGLGVFGISSRRILSERWNATRDRVCASTRSGHGAADADARALLESTRSIAGDGHGSSVFLPTESRHKRGPLVVDRRPVSDTMGARKRPVKPPAIDSSSIRNEACAGKNS